MQLPFTLEQFLNVFVAYNTAIWPIQVVLNVVGLLSIGLCLRANTLSRLISAILVVLWSWTGIVYHLMFFSTINPAAFVFGALFIVGAVCFAYAGVITPGLQFGVSRGWRTYLGGFFLTYGLLLYPLIGYVLGHRYPASPTFGAPCPTTIFTCGLLLWTTKPVKGYVMLVPLIWSFIGSVAAVKLGIREDIGLFVSGVVTTSTLLITGNSWSKRVAA
jgi:hypothetical protein